MPKPTTIHVTIDPHAFSALIRQLVESAHVDASKVSDQCLTLRVSKRVPVDAARTPASAVSRVVGTYPVVGDSAGEWALTLAQVDIWRDLYPTINVFDECRKAKAWLLANPSRRKTPRGMPPFLVNWLNKATNDGYGALRTSAPQPNKRVAGLHAGGDAFLRQLAREARDGDR